MQYIIADIHGCEVCTGRHKDQTGIIPIDVDFLKRVYMLFWFQKPLTIFKPLSKAKSFQLTALPLTTQPV